MLCGCATLAWRNTGWLTILLVSILTVSTGYHPYFLKFCRLRIYCSSSHNDFPFALDSWTQVPNRAINNFYDDKNGRLCYPISYGRPRSTWTVNIFEWTGLIYSEAVRNAVRKTSRGHCFQPSRMMMMMMMIPDLVYGRWRAGRFAAHRFVCNGHKS